MTEEHDVELAEENIDIVACSTFTQSKSITEIAKALCKMQMTALAAITDSDNPYYSSKYADLSSVWGVIRKPLTENGLSVVQLPSSGEGMVTVTTILLHVSGEFIQSSLTSNVPLDKKGKASVQKMGSAITYLRRYSLSAMVGVCPVDDDAELVMDHGNSSAQNAPDVPKPVKKLAKKPVPKPPVPKEDAIEVHGLPKGKQMIPLVFPEELAEYNISDEYQMNIKQFDPLGTHFDVNGTEVYTDRNGRYYSAAAGFSMSYGRVQADVVDAVLRFGIEKVSAMHKKVAFAEYGGK